MTDSPVLTIAMQDGESHETGVMVVPCYDLTQCRDGSPLLYLATDISSEVGYEQVTPPTWPSEPDPGYVAPTHCQRCNDPLTGNWKDGRVHLGNAAFLSEDIIGLCERCCDEFRMAYRGFMRGRKATVSDG